MTGAEKKECELVRNRKYYAAHREQIAAQRRVYRARNKESLAADNRAYRQTHAEEIAEQRRAYRHEHKDEINAQQKTYRKTRKTRLRMLGRMRKYGLALGEYEQMCQVQQGCCKICGDPSQLYIDHCHSTQRVRGLLCSQCNLLLGLAHDSPQLLLSAADYLRVEVEG
jgi:hypothetical protein